MTFQNPPLDELNVPAKFAPPRVSPRHIVRKKLLDSLRDAQHCALTLVTGNAGFGKTILLVQWRQELMKAGAEVAWLALTADHRHSDVFCRDLLGALAPLGVESEAAPLVGRDDRAWPVEPVAAAIIAGVQRVGKDLYLFIDDFQHVDDSWVHELVHKLVTHSPANLHMVIASRTTAPLGLSRLRVYGQLAEVGLEDLPFSLDETQAFFEQNLATMKLTANEVQLIQDVTRGWPASLQLVALMLRNRPAARGQVTALLRRSGDLHNYLAENVIAPAPAAMIQFLEMLAPLRRFNAALAAHVTQHVQAGDLLRRADEELLLIQRVHTGDRAPWYRFHPLLGEFLCNRLAQRGDESLQTLHRRASVWFAKHQMPADAVRHANLGGDLELAVQIIEQSMPPDWRFSAVAAMVQLLDHMPEDALVAHPQLSFLACLSCALSARTAEAQRWLEQLGRSESRLHADMHTQLALAEATIAMQRDESERVIELLGREPESWPANRTLRYIHVAALVTGYAHVGRLQEALKLHDEHAVPGADQGSEIALMFEATLPAALLVHGQVRETARLASALLEQAEAGYGRHSVPAGLCAAMLSGAYYELDRIDDARDVLANRTGLLCASWPDVMVDASVCHARLDRLDAGSGAALAFLQEQADHFHSMNLLRPAAVMLAEQVCMLLRDGDHVRAQGVLARLKALADTPQRAAGTAAEIGAITLSTCARLALVDCNAKEALAALDQVRAFAHAAGRARLLVRANLLAAAAWDSLQERDEAHRSLIEALNAGADLGLLRTFIDDGEPVVAGLAALRGAQGLTPSAASLLETVLDKLYVSTASAVRSGKSSAAQSLQHESVNLTPREREILLLISQAMSNKRIALTLNISVGTTKWNVRNILNKLDVSTRYDAMVWAREHGYIA
ncbi:HTH-type transcriptional regulator MalT [Paraburkholderia kirstenboschensis]|uniref:LuxR C-terminal-related transcriptional regulator n=1 Tax=Paraburkholderia kirstenboschensis TaxID=1245436 RepID=UPI00191861C8|nr:LuxR C-terminal-related transcriptional regulator [Paraburkholderia kirstenboschensis]CAD6551100.1 HTH-type transcriptional regulator MalT [Paraburkholderia kirstenboschensis]